MPNRISLTKINLKTSNEKLRESGTSSMFNMMDQDFNGIYSNDYGDHQRGRAISQLEFLSSKIGGKEKLAIHP